MMITDHYVVVGGVDQGVELGVIIGWDQVAQNLITYDQDVVLPAYLNQFLCLSFVPDPPRGIVGVGEEEYLGSLGLLFEVLIVNVISRGIALFFIVHLALARLPLQVFAHLVVVIVDRSGHQNPIVLFALAEDQQVDNVEEGRCHYYILLGDFNVLFSDVSSVVPVDDGVVVVVGGFFVGEVIEGLDSGDDVVFERLIEGQIHVCQRQYKVILLIVEPLG